ncbi:MAG TPA: PPC domain-containing DNA-binding protein, partial [Rubrobacteraceae bacterium]|nr:PPC domain-containing DNA-binding protein [Rubrobacteraceae bacterium]
GGGWRAGVGTHEEEVRMKAKLIYEEQGEKTFALVFDPGDVVMEELTNFAKENDLSAARFTAIGAFSDATLGYFDMDNKEYKEIPIDEQVEVLSLVGDVALFEGDPQLHAHAVLGRSDGTTRGGHLLEAHVQPTLEVVIVESPEHLRRETDEDTGLPLLAVKD